MHTVRLPVPASVLAASNDLLAVSMQLYSTSSKGAVAVFGLSDLKKVCFLCLFSLFLARFGDGRLFRSHLLFLVDMRAQ